MAGGNGRCDVPALAFSGNSSFLKNIAEMIKEMYRLQKCKGVVVILLQNKQRKVSCKQ